MLLRHAGEARKWRLGELLDEPVRFADFSLRCDGPAGAGLLLDFSRQRLNGETPGLLRALARARGLEAVRAALFGGEVVNPSENRAALHPDARSANPGNALLADQRERTGAFARRFRAGEAPGAGGRPLKRIVNIGIGGSDLGVRLLCSALGDETGAGGGFRGGDGWRRAGAGLSRSDPAETLFVLCSKSFSTAEALANAYSARHWLTAALGEDAPARHFAGVSANAEAMAAWGIAPDMAFLMPDAVGRRYSVWSAAGLSAWLSLGPNRMNEFLTAGRWLDRHFLRRLRSNATCLC